MSEPAIIQFDVARIEDPAALAQLADPEYRAGGIFENRLSVQLARAALAKPRGDE